MQNDGEIQTLRPAMGIVSERIQILLTRIADNDSPNRMRTIANAWIHFKEAVPKLESFVSQSALAKKWWDKLDREMDRAYHDYEAWQELQKWIEQYRKMLETEVKILKEQDLLISSEEAYNLVAKLLGVIYNTVDDPEQIREISYHFTQAVGDGVVVEAKRSRQKAGEERSGRLDAGELLDTRG